MTDISPNHQPPYLANYTLYTCTHYRQHASHVQYAPVTRAHGVADSEPASSDVLDKERTLLWQIKHWCVTFCLFASYVHPESFPFEPGAVRSARCFIVQQQRQRAPRMRSYEHLIGFFVIIDVTIGANTCFSS